MRLLLPGVLVLLAVSISEGGGDLRTRLQRRFPDCRGVAEGYYTGDGCDFYSRMRYSSDLWGFTLITDKARGEDWGDIVAAGARWTPEDGPVRSVSAGWLRADLGTGLVLSVPGSFSDVSELLLYKPPGSRNRLEPAASPRGCRGEPLTGAGASVSLGGLDFTLLAALSPADSLSSGYHRTPSELSGKHALLERLAAGRAQWRGIGVTLAAASREGEGWLRCGTDWTADLGNFRLSGEAALGHDSSGTAVAGWASLSGGTGGFRHMVMVIRNPDGFPDSRSSAPVSRECSGGITMGFRWTFLPRASLRAGTGVYLRRDDDLIMTSAEAEYRLPWRMNASVGGRVRAESGRISRRGWLGTVWQPYDALGVRTKLQLSDWTDSAADSAESGGGVELKLRCSLARWHTVDVGAAACSTDGYNSRVYAGGSVFPGVFGSTAIYGRTFLLFMQLALQLRERFVLRGAVSWKAVEDVPSLGSGWELTEGNSRTELGFQLDYSFE